MVRAPTVRIVESLKPPTGGDRAANVDGVVEGLDLRVEVRDSKTWSLQLRTVGGARGRLSFGCYPDVTLADARDKARKALAAVIDGANPALEAKA